MVKRVLFCSHNFSWSWLKHGIFFGPQNSKFGPKICFLPYDPRFGQRPVCSPRKDCPFCTLGSILGLSFSSYARWAFTVYWPMSQKVFPHPTVRAPSASNSPSAFSAGWIQRHVKLPFCVTWDLSVDATRLATAFRTFKKFIQVLAQDSRAISLRHPSDQVSKRFVRNFFTLWSESGSPAKE